MAGAGFGELVFASQNNTPDELIMASTTLSAAIKRQYSSVPPLSRHYLPPVFDKICGTAMNLAFFRPGNTNC